MYFEHLFPFKVYLSRVPRIFRIYLCHRILRLIIWELLPRKKKVLQLQFFNLMHAKNIKYFLRITAIISHFIFLSQNFKFSNMRSARKSDHKNPFVT